MLLIFSNSNHGINSNTVVTINNINNMFKIVEINSANSISCDNYVHNYINIINSDIAVHEYIIKCC